MKTSYVPGAREKFPITMGEFVAFDTQRTIQEQADTEIKQYNTLKAMNTRAQEREAKRRAALRDARSENIIKELTRIGFVGPTSGAQRWAEANAFVKQVLFEIESNEDNDLPFNFNAHLKTSISEKELEMEQQRTPGVTFPSVEILRLQAEVEINRLREKEGLVGLSEDEEVALQTQLRQMSSITRLPTQLTATQMEEFMQAVRDIQSDDEEIGFEEAWARAQEETGLFQRAPGIELAPGLEQDREDRAPGLGRLQSDVQMELAQPGDITQFGFGPLTDRDFISFLEKRQADLFGTPRELRTGGFEVSQKFDAEGRIIRDEIESVTDERFEFGAQKKEQERERLGLTAEELPTLAPGGVTEGFAAFKQRAAKALAPQLRTEFETEREEERLAARPRRRIGRQITGK